MQVFIRVLCAILYAYGLAYASFPGLFSLMLAIYGNR
jgi:ABC-type glycerol-3-phosphate transport system permease component